MVRAGCSDEGALQERREALFEQVQRRASRFELGALIKLLFDCGFDWETIRFEGVKNLVDENGPFIRKLTIESDPSKVATLSLNAGLLGSVSPLPAYFKDFARRLANPDDFISFLGFWDAIQLKDRAVGLLPQLGPDRGVLAQAHLARMQTATVPFLHHAFRGLFPELSVLVSRRSFYRLRAGTRARVGAPLDGRIVLGSQFGEKQVGFAVCLYAEGESSAGVRDWEKEAALRLNHVEPLLARQKSPIEVSLQFESYRYGQELVKGGESRPQLGVRPWLSKERSQKEGAGKVVLRAPWSRVPS